MKRLAFALAALFVSAAALAHSGGTDSQGCHYDHRNGTRHCH